MRSSGFRLLLTLGVLTCAATQAPAQAASWFFAVSGDSRDCGDLIMPKIARSIEARRAQAPVAFYWHLGDFRRIFEIDCDMLKRGNPAAECKAPRAEGAPGSDAVGRYLDTAWDDFAARQLAPFGALPVFLGIGNHELYAGKTRDDFRRKFQRWLTQEPIHSQRQKDYPSGGTEGETYYHFVRGGVDFISLDNASGAFEAEQMIWLGRVLAADAKNDAVRAIVAGMHEALPYSQWRSHAMDRTCAGRCSGQAVYDMLFRAAAVGPPEQRKKVHVFASHSHLMAADIYNTPEHAGQVLPGWIVGTAGAEQYRENIQYGYLEVEVHPDGTLEPRFVEVGRDAPPLAAGPEAQSLTEFCFTVNKRPGGAASDRLETDCACGAVK